MCLNPKHKNAKVAKKDIECIKWLDKDNKNFISPYQCMIYKLGSTYEAKFSFHNDTIEEGIHAFRGTRVWYTKYFKSSTVCKTDVFVKAIIPKGTKYYVGKNYDIVAEKMIITKEIIQIKDSYVQ